MRINPGPVNAMFTSGTALALVFGVGYLFDCRLNTKGGWALQDRCWLTAGSMMGIGGGAGMGFAIGYNTYNPTLRDPSERSRRTAAIDQLEP